MFSFSIVFATRMLGCLYTGKYYLCGPKSFKRLLLFYFYYWEARALDPTGAGVIGKCECPHMSIRN